MTPEDSSTSSRPMTVYVLKVTLLDVVPQVWRLVRVPSAVTLAGLHRVLQEAIGWEDRHLHEWTLDERTYGAADEEDWGEEILDEQEAVLGDLAGPDAAFRYTYDLGDLWEHLVEVVSVEPYEATVPPVEVIDGARSAPIEDCGGPAGYEHLLDALADPDDEDHEELVERYGDWWDPVRFDRAAVNRRLEALWRVS